MFSVHARSLATAITAIAWLPLAAAAQLESDAPEQALVDPTAIVVLPVEARTVETGYQELADLVYAELLSRFRARTDVNIIDRSRVEVYAGSDLEPAEIGRRLGAEHVLDSYVAPDKQGYVLSYKVYRSDGSVTQTGSGLSLDRWQPGGSLHHYILKAIDRLVETIGPKPTYEDALAAYYGKRNAALARFLDTRLDDRTRIRALNGVLPGIYTTYPRTYSDGGEFATPEFVEAAINLGLNSRDEIVRSRMWSVMTGVFNSALIEPLRHAAESDPNAGVRKAAVDALAHHRSAPGVIDSLKAIAQHDSALNVRNAAQLAAAAVDDRRTVLEGFVMDESLPDRQRRLNLYTLWNLIREDDSGASDELLLSLAEFATVTTDERVPSIANIVIAEAGGPTAARLLLEALDRETSESGRADLISSFDKVSSERGITELLNDLATNDPSPLVRESAKDALERASK